MDAGGVPQYFLNPGELIFSKKPVLIKTVLGSCVAVTMYDKINKYGGMIHYLLPDSSNSIVSTKYGDVAIPTLINKFIKEGSKKQFLEATVTGGAFIIFDESEIFFIGDRNIEIAQTILKQNEIRVVASNTGGERGRRVIFNSYTNQVDVSLLEGMHLDDLYNK
ncbi:MAG: chemotaxis protein CheD [Brevinematales bacterium]|nr:chemotaxis protein CheD [Brevinematales bacterium]